MKRYISAALGVVLAAVLALWLTIPAEGEAPVAGSVLRVFHDQGHGSGVHVGMGYIITAAHVVAGKGDISIRDDEGRESEASVLWANSEYDVALMHVVEYEALSSSHLSCRSPEPGEMIEARGNPMKLEFARVYGRVSGKPSEFGNWKSVVPLDMTVAPGISGGPIFSAHGEVIGIAVGVSLYSIGMSPSLVPIGYGVGADVICHLMGR